MTEAPEALAEESAATVSHDPERILQSSQSLTASDWGRPRQTSASWWPGFWDLSTAQGQWASQTRLIARPSPRL